MKQNTLLLTDRRLLHLGILCLKLRNKTFLDRIYLPQPLRGHSSRGRAAQKTLQLTSQSARVQIMHVIEEQLCGGWQAGNPRDVLLNKIKDSSVKTPNHNGTESTAWMPDPTTRHVEKQPNIETCTHEFLQKTFTWRCDLLDDRRLMPCLITTIVGCMPPHNHSLVGHRSVLTHAWNPKLMTHSFGDPNMFFTRSSSRC